MHQRGALETLKLIDVNEGAAVARSLRKTLLDELNPSPGWVEAENAYPKPWPRLESRRTVPAYGWYFAHIM